ncbi:hypothetical protein [Alcaligenes sp. SDU_A2]|uniref:hypothetical protein n=1 Tax=Alcaligenes sp. SDU_A2 TaxID=3136634 RepID=UPI002CF5EF60|nr:hypothetical protein [Alcaligenes sp.]HRL28506.1 hypothetical protein [Alcaligenes sp.]
MKKQKRPEALSSPTPAFSSSDPELLQKLEQLEALLIHAVSANVQHIAPSSQKSLLELAHDITCSAIIMVHDQRHQ